MVGNDGVTTFELIKSIDQTCTAGWHETKYHYPYSWSAKAIDVWISNAAHRSSFYLTSRSVIFQWLVWCRLRAASLCKVCPSSTKRSSTKIAAKTNITLWRSASNFRLTVGCRSRARWDCRGCRRHCRPSRCRQAARWRCLRWGWRSRPPRRRPAAPPRARLGTAPAGPGYIPTAAHRPSPETARRYKRGRRAHHQRQAAGRARRQAQTERLPLQAAVPRHRWPSRSSPALETPDCGRATVLSGWSRQNSLRPREGRAQWGRRCLLPGRWRRPRLPGLGWRRRCQWQSPVPGWPRSRPARSAAARLRVLRDAPDSETAGCADGRETAPECCPTITCRQTAIAAAVRHVLHRHTGVLPTDRQTDRQNVKF